MTVDTLFTQFDSVFFEKTRLSMMTILYKEEPVSFNRLKKVIGGTDGSIYTHLQKLQEAGYIGQQKEIKSGKAQTSYFLTAEGKKIFRKYIKFMEEMIHEQKRGKSDA
jgi:DNA-binding MarR family transcriptional regulator